jgi:YVTN family beta-propeller protein
VGQSRDGECQLHRLGRDPPDALPLASDTANIQAASVASPETTDTAMVNTRVLGEETAYVTLIYGSKIVLVDVATQVPYDSIDTTQYGCYYSFQAAITPGGDYVYVSCNDSGSVLVIETGSNSVVANITSIPAAYGIAFAADSAHALVGSIG